MAQYPEFYQYHKENGSKFKALFVDTGYLDKKIGFPISQVDNLELVQEYINLIKLKRVIKLILNHSKGLKLTKNEFNCYLKAKADYFSKLPNYHTVRKYF